MILEKIVLLLYDVCVCVLCIYVLLVYMMRSMLLCAYPIVYMVG